MAVLHFLPSLATPISAYATLILVLITGYYAHKTSKILEESRKSREAAERQASAAEESLRVLSQQLEEQVGWGKTVVGSAIRTAMTNIQYWQASDILNLAYRGALPQTINLVPANQQAAVEHACPFG